MREGTVRYDGAVTSAPPPEEARRLLREIFGHADFRGRQAEIVGHLVAGGDALVLMPTGGGKSLCYQLPALLREGTAVVVSPLLALMKDQVDALRQNGVAAARLDSTLDAGEARRVEADFAAGRLKLLYVAPERLVTPRFGELLGRATLGLLAIDEAHCVSQWGHDFRPEYLELGALRERFPQVPRVALTATADPATRREIAERLLLPDASIFAASFDRPNLHYRIVERERGREPLLAFLAGQPAGASGIVYRRTRDGVETTARQLVAHGRDALPYHAGLDKAVRERHQDRFRRDEGVIVVATVAFGMGIDKPDVRFVAHLDLPDSLEAFYQESGRAGRDGLPADSWLAWGLRDLVLARARIERSEADEARKRVERRKLEAVVALCETVACRRQVLLRWFGEEHPGSCGACDNCLEPVATWDATEPVRKALSAVYRTGQRFGARHVVDVLRGEATERAVERGHDRLPVFGIGADLPAAQWSEIFRQLVARGFLATDGEGYGTLALAAAARPVLRGDEPVRLRHLREP
ncbi:MAG: DNA helicase RecQ, partial [Thermoanaerobaculia bacterium]|nr:DNA helicase RecQ [Thermoanaerobaculia bacterium]